MSAKATQTVSLSSKELEGVIEVLSSAGHAFPLTPFERFSYRALMLSVDLAAISFILFSVGLIFGLSSPEVSEKSSPETPMGPFGWLTILSLFVLSVSFLVGIVSLVLNIPVLLKTFRERAKLKELGLSSLSQSLWKESQRSRWIGRVRGMVLIVFSIYFLYASLSSLVSLMYANFESDFESGDSAKTVFTFTGAFAMLFGGLLFAGRYLRNQRERIESTASAEELRKALESLRRRAGEAGVVSVPAELLQQTAKIESTQIAKERKDAILESVAIRPTGYTIAFDRDATEQRAKLGVGDRVELEDFVAQLSTELEPQTGAVAGAKGLTLRGTTKSKHLEIEYVIDHASRGIRINAVRHQREGSHTSLNGASHA
jgi:hypothetical protein